MFTKLLTFVSILLFNIGGILAVDFDSASSHLNSSISYNLDQIAIGDNPASFGKFQGKFIQLNASRFHGIYNHHRATYAQSWDETGKKIKRLYTALSLPIGYINGIDEATNASGQGIVTNQFSDYQIQLKSTVAAELYNKLFLGATVSYHYHKIYQESARYLSLNLGTKMHLKQFIIAGSISNIPVLKKKWSTDLIEKISSGYHFGIATSIIKNTLITSDIHYKNKKWSFDTGLDYQITNQFSLGLGCKSVLSNKIYYITPKLSVEQLGLRYLLSYQKKLGLSHEIIITMNL